MLEWFWSYLSGRTFRVVFSGCTLSIIYVICSVPQGSVLGQLLFIIYTADLAAIAEKHDVFLHAFVNDTQPYLHCHHTETASAAARLEQCIIDMPTSRRCRCRIMATSPIHHPTALVVPRHQLSSYGRPAFYVAGLSVWNSLLDSAESDYW